MKIKVKILIISFTIVLIVCFTIITLSIRSYYSSKRNMPFRIACYSNMHVISDLLEKYHKTHNCFPNTLAALANENNTEFSPKILSTIFNCPENKNQSSMLNNLALLQTNYIYLGAHPVSIKIDGKLKDVILFCPTALKKRNDFIGIVLIDTQPFPLRSKINNSTFQQLLKIQKSIAKGKVGNP